MLVNLVLMLGIRAAILDIAIQDCDAFDSENVREQGVEYVCNPAGYSAELDTLCRMVGL